MIYDGSVSSAADGFLAQELISADLLPPRVETIDPDRNIVFQSADLTALPSVNSCYCTALEYLTAHGGNIHIALAHGKNPLRVDPDSTKTQLRLLCHHASRLERYIEASTLTRQLSPEFIKFARTPHSCEFKPFLEEEENIAFGINESRAISPARFVCYHPAESGHFLCWKMINSNTLSYPREGGLFFSTRALDIRQCYEQLSTDELDQNNRIFTGGNGYVYRSKAEGAPVVVNKTAQHIKSKR